MSEWTRVAQPVRCKVELDRQLTVRRERGVLAQGDANANAIIAEVYMTDGLPYDLTGCTAMLTFVRPDNLALPPIAAEISGNTATATLTDACYEVRGTYVATMQLRKGGDERTILWLIGDVKGKDIDGIVDPDHEIISIEDLMATAAEAQKAANVANTAAARANAGADRVEQLQIDASGLAGDSNKLGGKPPEYYLPAVNLLDNSDFAVAQAGYNQYHGATHYAADRWISSPDSVLTLNGEIKTFAAGAGYSVANQILWRDGQDKGKTYTVAIELSNGTLRVASGTSPANEVSAETIVAEVWFDNNCSLLILKQPNGDFSVRLNAHAAGASCSFKHIRMFEGIYTADTLPPFVPPDPVLELAKCQEYYVGLGSDAGIYGYTSSSGTIYAFVPLPQFMRLKNVSLDANSKIIIVSSGVSVEIGEFMGVTIRGNQLELKAAADSRIPVLAAFSGWVSQMGISADL